MHATSSTVDKSAAVDHWTLPGCVFCDPEKIASPIRWETGIDGYGRFMVFEPLNPVTAGHELVVPAHHVAHAATNPRITAGAVFVASLVARQHEAANIITSIGEAATQTVGHLHLHVVPRRHGDGLPLPWTPQHTKEHL